MESETTGGMPYDMEAPFMDRRILDRKSKIGWNSPLTEWFKGEGIYGNS